jgi:hypothetical protein
MCYNGKSLLNNTFLENTTMLLKLISEGINSPGFFETGCSSQAGLELDYHLLSPGITGMHHYAQQEQIILFFDPLKK